MKMKKKTDKMASIKAVTRDVVWLPGIVEDFTFY